MQKQLLNLIQWEQSIRLSSHEEDLVKQFELLESSNTDQFKSKQVLEQPPEQLKMIEFIMNLVENVEPSQDNIVNEIEDVLCDYQKKNEVFKVLLKNLAIICQQLKQLEIDKDQVISGINQFHDQSNLYIQQQKAMIEMQNQIQEYLQYYLNIEKLDQELENLNKYDILTQRSQFEFGLQRLMSEITDGIVFFNSKTLFHQSIKYLDQYKALKKKLLTATKNHLLRTFNKEYSFTNSQFSKLKFTEVLSIFYPFFINLNEDETITITQPNPMKLQFLQVVFPQFISTMQIYEESGIKKVSNQQLDEQYEKFQVTKSLKHFCNFLETQLDKDQEIHDLYNDVFLELRSYCRLNLHQQISEQVSKQIQSISHLGSTLLRIKAQLTGQVEIKTQEQKDFLDTFKNKGQIVVEPLIFEILLAFIFELFINETLYYKIIFSSNIKMIEDNNQNVSSQICDLYYQTIRSFILKISNLDVLIKFAQEAKRLGIQTSKFVSHLSSNQLHLYHYISQTLQFLFSESKSQTQTQSEYLSKQLNIFNAQFLDKTRMDLMQRIIALCHIEIQEQIYNYNMKDFYHKIGKLQIYKFVPHGNQQPKFYKLQKDEIFPTVQRGVTLILKLSEVVDKKVFEQLAGEILREVNNQIKEVADRYDLKFDSYLFFIKQLLILTESLLPLGGNFILKEQELDFTETKTMLLQLISGQIRPNIKWIELTSADKLWGYTTNFFSFIYKGMPKLNQYEVDLKHNMIILLKNVTFSFVKDMTFVMCKNVIDFLRKYQYLQYILTNKDQDAQLSNVVSAEQAQMDFQVLIQRENIIKTYVFFIENLSEFTDEMISKLNNYTNINNFEKFKPYIIDIIQNSVSLLSQFFIDVSKHYDGEAYDSFEFKTVDEVSKLTMRKINFMGE